MRGSKSSCTLHSNADLTWKNAVELGLSFQNELNEQNRCQFSLELFLSGAYPRISFRQILKTFQGDRPSLRGTVSILKLDVNFGVSFVNGYYDYCCKLLFRGKVTIWNSEKIFTRLYIGGIAISITPHSFLPRGIFPSCPPVMYQELRCLVSY